jgi:ribosomal protein S6--L-glutamate ligase
MTPKSLPDKYIALGSRLRGVPEVLTLGVKPNFLDYSREERHKILNAPIVLYPTKNYARFLTTLGRRIFPSLETYLYSDEKILQSTLFQMLKINHPRTRFYYALHHGDILKDFEFPFVAKLPRASSQGRGVFLIRKHNELEEYLCKTKIAYIQEFMPHNRDLRVVLINYKPVTAYWRTTARGSFKANLSQGGIPDFNDIPGEALNFAETCARKCRFNDVGLDFVLFDGRWYLIEANMKYGRKALKIKDLCIKEIIREKLLNGEIQD